MIPGVKYPYSIGMNQVISQFNAHLQKIANRFGCRVEQFKFQADDFYDGVHLNEQGTEHAAAQLVQKVLADRGIEIPGVLNGQSLTAHR